MRTGLIPFLNDYCTFVLLYGTNLSCTFFVQKFLSSYLKQKVNRNFSSFEIVLISILIENISMTNFSLQNIQNVHCTCSKLKICSFDQRTPQFCWSFLISLYQGSEPYLFLNRKKWHPMFVKKKLKLKWLML